MTTALLEATLMAPGKKNTVSVKLEEDVVDQARIVASYRKQSITDLLGELLRPALTKLEQEEVAKRSKLIQKPRGSKD